LRRFYGLAALVSAPAVLVMAAAVLAAPPGATAGPSGVAGTPVVPPVPWRHNYEAARREAAAADRPLFVVFRCER
jgi:hypothetical protein